MVKATLKSAVLLGIFAMAVPAYAEVQNVRVGGDITVRGFHRENLDLQDNSGALDTEDNFFMTTTGLNVGADLTENVSAFVRVANERDWNFDGTSTYTDSDDADTTTVTDRDSGDLDLSQAYITLKELFYSPLTLRVGAQPIVWGRGFVLGSNLIPGLINGGGDRNNAISANEFTDFTAFDAVRATLDLSGVAGLPWTVDAVYIKLDENGIGTPDDVNLAGFNVGTKLEDMNAEFEAYWLNKRDRSTQAGASLNQHGNVNTIGVRGSVRPAEGSYLYGELAYQFGDSATDPHGVRPTGNGVNAWAFDLGGEYTFADVSFTPKLGVEAIYFSGKEIDDGTALGWDPIARGYFTTVLREFQNPTAAAFYPNSQACQQPGSLTTACPGSATNQLQLSLYGSVKPIEDLTIDQRLSWFFLPVGARPSTAAGAVAERKNYAGAEWDTILTYDYTSDVQFGVIYGLFLPGDIYRAPTEATAQELVTSVSVKF